MKTLYLNTNDQIQEILDQYPDHERLEIHLAPGRYYQKLRINHNHLKLIGSNCETTVIEYDDYSYKMHNDGLLFNTFRTSTLTILSDHVELKNITIENTSGSGPTIGQAVALSIYGDHTRIISCRLLGHQDTLFIGPLPIDLVERYDQFLPDTQRQIEETLSIFSKCIIIGDVDFIFGSGTALFDQCQIIALNKGYICAPSTYVSFSYGLIFNDCDIISKSSENDVYLARPWRTFGSTVFYNCRFIGLFHSNRYDNWDKLYYRFYEYPYVQSSLAKPLEELMIKHINALILSIKDFKN